MASTFDWNETVTDGELILVLMKVETQSPETQEIETQEIETQHWELSDEQLIEAILDFDTTFDASLFDDNDDMMVSQPSQFGDEELIEFVLNYDTSLD